MTADDAMPGFGLFPAFAPMPSARRTAAAVPGAAAAGLARVRQLLDALKQRSRRRPDGGPPPPEEPLRSDSIWDDPELWLLMLH